ncbi:MAG: SdpI family protein [Clostridium sp.]
MPIGLLVGVLLLVCGVVTMKLPPKVISDSVGYRSEISKSSQDAWDKAQRYSSYGAIINGIFNICIHLIFFLINPGLIKYELLILIVSVIVFYIVIENKLWKKCKVISK